MNKRIQILIVFLVLIISFNVNAQPWIQLKAAVQASFALDSNQVLFACGANPNGQLGIPGADVLTEFTKVSSAKWRLISAGPSYTAGIQEDGTLWHWGLGVDRQYEKPTKLGFYTDWIDLSVGVRYILLLRSDSTLWSVGLNDHGQLGLGQMNSSIPRQVSTKKFVSISAGQDHCLAIAADGTLWSWGNGEDGALGFGNENSISVPTQLGTDTNWVDVEASANFSVALKSNGEIFTWGANFEGQLGIGTMEKALIPTKVSSPVAFKHISAGGAYVLALDLDGVLWAWGNNSFSQHGSFAYNRSTVPRKPLGVVEWITVSAAKGNRIFSQNYARGEHSLGFVSNSKEMCTFGRNFEGQLGLGYFSSQENAACEAKTTGIDDQGKKEQITVYPNPARSSITISGVHVSKVSIYDLRGNTVLTAVGISKQLNISALASGIYHLQITDGEGVIYSHRLEVLR